MVDKVYPSVTVCVMGACERTIECGKSEEITFTILVQSQDFMIQSFAGAAEAVFVRIALQLNQMTGMFR